MTIQGEHKDRTEKNVKEFWDSTAKEGGPTIRDIYFQKLEVAEIVQIVKQVHNANVLDIGCGTGYATAIYSNYVNNIIGIDYAKDFIDKANEYLHNYPNIKNAGFRVADITNLPFLNDEFDVVIGERILINISTWEQQQRGIDEIFRVLKKGGIYISVEVTEQGHDNITYYRNILGLEKLEKYWHNLYINEDLFLDYVKNKAVVNNIRRFGLYHFISKVIHPLLVTPNVPRFDDKINEIAATVCLKLSNKDIDNFGDINNCSHQVMFILQKS